MFLRFFFFFSFSFYFSLFSSNIDSLISKIHSSSYHLDKQWLLLLHYQKKGAAYKSSASNQHFFLSSDGQTNPKSELLATVTSFFQPVPVKEEEHTICLFPARFLWFKQTFDLKQYTIPKPNCHEYNTFLQKMQGEQLSLVFSSANMNEAATFFGHTMLRFDKFDTGDEEDRTLSVVADIVTTTKDKPILIGMLSGVFHGFSSIVQLSDFQSKIQEYAFIENRNLWEYQLNFSKEEMLWILAHAWEIDYGGFRYSFFTENCSYFNIYLLELARPTLNLLQFFSHRWTTPAETILEVFKNKNLVTSSVFYPSNTEDYKKIYSLLNYKERSLVRELIKNPNVIVPTNKNINTSTVLNAAMRGIWVGMPSNKIAKEKFIESKNPISDNLESIAVSNNISPASYTQPNDTDPSKGLPPNALSIAGGYSSSGWFTALSYRPVFHDILDSPLGYLPFMEVAILKSQWRYYGDAKKFDLENLTFIKIISLNSIEYNIWKSSWLVDTGIRSLYMEGFKSPIKKYNSINLALAYYFKFGYGASFKLRFIPKDFIFYSLLNLVFESSFNFLHGVRLAPVPTVGFIWRFTSKISWVTSLEYHYFFFSDINQSQYGRLVLQSGFNINLYKHFALEANILDYISFPQKIHQYEMQLSTKIYF